MFIKEKKDKQEEHLKLFYLPEDHEDFGIDLPNEYGTLIYYDDNGKYHEEKVESVKGDYGYYYDALYETLINHQDVLVTPEQTLLQIELLEKGIQGLK